MILINHRYEAVEKLGAQEVRLIMNRPPTRPPTKHALASQPPPERGCVFASHFISLISLWARVVVRECVHARVDVFSKATERCQRLPLCVQSVPGIDRIAIPSVMVNWDVGSSLRAAVHTAQDFIMQTDSDITYLPVNFTFLGTRGCHRCHGSSHAGSSLRRAGDGFCLHHMRIVHPVFGSSIRAVACSVSVLMDIFAFRRC